MTSIIFLQVVCILLIIFAIVRMFMAVTDVKMTKVAKAVNVLLNGIAAAAGVFVLKAGLVNWTLAYIGVSFATTLMVPMIIGIVTLGLLIVSQAARFDRKVGINPFPKTSPV